METTERQFFFVKISCPKKPDDNYHFGEILENLTSHNIFTTTIYNISWLKDAEMGDLFFLHVGGDVSNKRKYFSEDSGLQNYENAIYGVGKIEIIDESENSIKASFYPFSSPVTRKELYFFPQFIDSMGGSTKGIANQAGLYDVELFEAFSFVEYLRINNKIGKATEIFNEMDTDGYLYEKAVEKISNDNELFTSSSKKLFSEIRDLNQSKNLNLSNLKFDANAFIQEINNSNFLYDAIFLKRFIASLLTKPFLILTGLSGSGKTLLAQSFSKWITIQNSFIEKNFHIEADTIIESAQVSYRVSKSDNISIILEQVDTKVKATLSYDLIKEWVETIKSNGFDISTPARTIREAVKSKSEYSPQENSFETRLKAVSFFLINKKPSKYSSRQVNLLPVGANWIDSEPLLGYPNALENGEYVLPESGVLQLILDAKRNPTQPYFLILDEMNLSHVERYFADFLSSIESHDKIKLHSGSSPWQADGYIVPPTLSVPKNFFIVGTVNIDETTYMFSPKVLDRANVLEFRVAKNEMKRFLKTPINVNFSTLEGKGASMAEDFVEIAKSNGHTYSEKDKLSEELLKFFSELNTVGAEFGYRSAYEIQRFAGLAEQLAKDWKFEQIMDAAIAQKLLPKLHGSRRKLEKILFSLGDLCYPELEKGCDDLFKKHDNITEKVIEQAKYPISFEKIVRMHKGLVENGFTSFAEA